MLYKKFRPRDIFYNTIVSNPKYSASIHSGSLYLNGEVSEKGHYGKNVRHVPQGYLSLYELNINRSSDSMIYPFVEKSGTRTAFKTVTTSTFDDTSQFTYSDVMSGSYPLSASINRIFIPSGIEMDDFSNPESPVSASYNKKYIRSLKNIINNPGTLSKNYSYGNLGTSKINMICIPSIYYGSSVQRGSVKLNYYITGTLVATAEDSRKNGQLYQTYGSSPEISSSAGIVLYDQGLILLTGSWSMGSGTEVVSSSYNLDFAGTNHIPTITLMAHAEKGEHNYSHNPTFIDFNDKRTLNANSTEFLESRPLIKNIRKSDAPGHRANFQKITYISKVGIYDKNKNLIAIATMASPVRKSEKRDYTFKIRMDF